MQCYKVYKITINIIIIITHSPIFFRKYKQMLDNLGRTILNYFIIINNDYFTLQLLIMLTT